MAIDPKILSRMHGEDHYLADADADKPLPADRHPNCATLTGAWKQKKWAIDLRNVALDLKWPEDVVDRLKRVTDSTWWIANRNIVKDMKYKEPVLSQMHTGSGPRQLPQQTNLGVGIGPRFESTLDGVVTAAGALDADERQNRRARDAAARVSDAERWAASVSQNPKLAEAAILAVLSRLYEGTMKARLRNSAREALDAVENAVAKDTDAINRMLT